MNRFSSLGPDYNIQSNYIPLPLDLISKKLEQQQQKHDAIKASFGAMEEAVLGVQGLGVDTETLKARQAEYNDEILKGIEEVGGDYYRLGALSDVMGKKLQKDLTVGQLAGIRSNYLAAQEHIKTLDKLKETGIIGDRGYNKGMRSISDFAGTVETPEGGYTRASFYTPVKEISLPKAAQDFSKNIHDQYTAAGETYLDKDRVSSQIYKDLMLDESVVSNIKEDISYRYGDLSPKEEQEKIQMYAKVLADNAANEVSFFKPLSGADKLANKQWEDYNAGTEIPYDFTSDNPQKTSYKGRFKVKTKMVIENFKSPLSAEEFDKEYKTRFMEQYRESMTPMEKINLQTKVRNDINNQYKDKVVVTAILEDPILRDKLEVEGIDINSKSKKELEEYLEKLDEKIATPRTTRGSLYTGKKELEEFDIEVNQGLLNRSNVRGIDGSIPTDEDIAAINQLSAKDSGVGYKFTGRVNGSIEAQPLPDNAKLFSIKVGDELKKFYKLPYNTNDPRYKADRAKYALTSPEGRSSYIDGSLGEITFQRVLNPVKELRSDPRLEYVVKMYVNGSEFADPNNPVPTIITPENLGY